MVKKIAALAGAGVILLSVVAPVLAWDGWWGGGDVEVEVENDDTYVDTYAIATSNTGGNSQDATAMFGTVNAAGDRLISTGNAYSKAKAVSVVNTSLVCVKPSCRCKGDVEVEVENDDTYVDTYADAYSDTGLNSQDAEAKMFGTVNAGGSRTTYTGSAWSKVKAYSVVNTTLIH